MRKQHHVVALAIAGWTAFPGVVVALAYAKNAGR